MTNEFSMDDLRSLGPIGEYSPFNPLLDEKYPINALVSKRVQEEILNIIQKISQTDSEKEHFLAGMTRSYHPWVVFGSSPAAKAESESLMGNILDAAIMAGQWVNIPMRSDEEPCLYNTEQGVFDFNPYRKEWGKGADRLVEVGLAEKVLDDDGGPWLRPTEKMLEFFDERFTKYSLKPVE
ncbi:hypothetical protein HYT59_00820 [Candidatus Woesebacteria bacterium]|nr:hypothetical protein [Candidatus Woesebacteria bacterium]